MEQNILSCSWTKYYDIRFIKQIQLLAWYTLVCSLVLVQKKLFMYQGKFGSLGFKLMKGKALKKHSQHDKNSASVLLKLFISDNEGCHTTDAPSVWAELFFPNVNNIQPMIQTHYATNLCFDAGRGRTCPCPRTLRALRRSRLRAHPPRAVPMPHTNAKAPRPPPLKFYNWATSGVFTNSSYTFLFYTLNP